MNSSVLVSTLLRFILPTSASVLPEPSIPRATRIASIVITALSTALQFVAFALAGTTKRCAPQGKRENNVATDHTADGANGLALTTSQILKPVSEFSSCSPISFVLFSWMTPVLNTGAKLESMSQDDLPALCANDRAPNLFEQIKKTTAHTRPQWINGLLWRLLLVNKRLFLWRRCCVEHCVDGPLTQLLTRRIRFSVNGCLHLVSIFRTRRRVSADALVTAIFQRSFFRSWSHFSKCQAQMTHRRLNGHSRGATSSVLVFLFRSCSKPLLADSCGSVRDRIADYCVLRMTDPASLYSVSNSMLSTRIRVQLNCLIFDKTLRVSHMGLGWGERNLVLNS